MMSTAPFTYNMYDGSFLTSPPELDRTVNILMFRDPEQLEYQLTINRATLRKEETLEQFCEKEITLLRNKLPGFQTEGQLLRHELGPGKLAVVQVANCYLADGKKVHQVQSIIQLPQHNRYNPVGDQLIIFSLVAKQEFSEYQRKHYVQVINSFTPEME
jgi:hypothetical protein